MCNLVVCGGGGRTGAEQPVEAAGKQGRVDNQPGSQKGQQNKPEFLSCEGFLADAESEK